MIISNKLHEVYSACYTKYYQKKKQSMLYQGFHWRICNGYNFSGLRSLPHFCSCKKYSSYKTYKFANLIVNASKATKVVFCVVCRGKTLIFTKLNRENLPNNMLAEFSRLVGTWKSTIPAMERGILFSDPTRLQR